NSQSLIILSDERNVEDEGGFSSLPSPVSSPLGQAHSVLSSPPQLAVVCHTKRTLNPISLLSKSTFESKKIEPGCFRQNIIGVTINGSLGEDALIYSLNVVDKPMPRGEIVAGDNSVTAGYFNNQAKTDEVYKRNGAEQAGVKYSDFSELCENGDAVNEVQQSLTKAAKLENKDKVIAGAVDIRVGTSTAALKIKREKIKAKFKDELHKLIILIHATATRVSAVVTFNIWTFKGHCRSSDTTKGHASFT
ncbi:hypothetical protein HID58_075843, partial [Brassica napus]